MKFITYEIYGEKSVPVDIDVEGYYCPVNLVCEFSGGKDASTVLLVLKKDDLEKFESPEVFTYDNIVEFPDYALIQLESVVISEPGKMERISIERINKILDVKNCYVKQYAPKNIASDYVDIVQEYLKTSNEKLLYDLSYYRLLEICDNATIHAIYANSHSLQNGYFKLDEFMNERLINYDSGFAHLTISKDAKIKEEYENIIKSTFMF